ncbi:QRFP-like peptide receptor [Saccoglossus kowalevskii]|uniref:Kappa-type opioid receptor-like n=1 Tax=Saccoglossus kowalevskii TaxID=10224 RepID=A0ABM0MRS4_SACKO|nr:PREDICTED: kappa-type opioid receptor-like [Saccoglossus kowalevskii]
MKNFTVDVYDDSDYLDTSYYLAPDGLWIWHATEEDIEESLVNDEDAAILTIAMPIVFIIGCLGNIFTIFVILRISEMRTVTNYFLVNLAIADLIFLIMVVPPKFMMYILATVHLEGNWTIGGAVGCKILSYAPRVAQSVSCFIILILTMERYFAICWPLKFRGARTKKKAICVSGLTWLAAGTFGIPHAYFPRFVQAHIVWPPSYNETDVPDVISRCSPCDVTSNCGYYNTYGKIDEVIFLCIVPVLVILYILMLLRLRRANKFGRAARVRGANSMRAKTQLIRMLGMTVTLYLICVGPFRTLALLTAYEFPMKDPDTAALAVNVARVLLYVNSATNPIIYNVFNKKFRSAFFKVLICQGNKVNPENESSSDNVALTNTDDGYRKRPWSLRRSRKRGSSRRKINGNGSSLSSRKLVANDSSRRGRTVTNGSCRR